MREVILTDQAPAPIGPYVQAIVNGDFMFVSGQLGIDMSTGMLPENVVDQARCSLENLKSILGKNGMSFKNVAKSTVFLTDLQDFSSVNEIYAQYFGDTPSARSCIQVAGLPLGAKVEIEVIACK